MLKLDAYVVCMQMVRFLDGMLKITYDLWQPSLSGLDMAQCYGTGQALQLFCFVQGIEFLGTSSVTASILLHFVILHNLLEAVVTCCDSPV